MTQVAQLGERLQFSAVPIIGDTRVRKQPPIPKPEKPSQRNKTGWRNRAPFAPDTGKLARFWLAGPLTCVIFTPALLSGVFGAPAMLPGMYCAWRMLRAGDDDYSSFAACGFLVGVATLFVAATINLPYAQLFIFGLLFGPLMAMCFRAISGRWRG